jgi:hypothetical protein
VTAEERIFLNRLIQYGGAAATRVELPPANRGQDKARQAAKRKGWVSFKDGYWRITDLGREAWKSGDI